MPTTTQENASTSGMSVTIIDSITTSPLIASTLMPFVRSMSAKNEWFTYAVIVTSSRINARLITISSLKARNGVTESIPLAIKKLSSCFTTRGLTYMVITLTACTPVMERTSSPIPLLSRSPKIPTPMGIIMSSLSGTVGLPFGWNVIRLSRLISVTPEFTKTGKKTVGSSTIQLFVFMNALRQRSLVAKLFSF